MQKQFIFAFVLIVAASFSMGCPAFAEDGPATKSASAEKQPSTEMAKSEAPTDPGCAPKVVALREHALVSLPGTGEGDVVVVTDPFCWHCRLGHKLLSEMPELYGTVKFLFFPRRSFIASDMAAWILEDAVGTDHLKAMVDYAYTDLKRPKADDVVENRMIILAQFAEAFPFLLDNTTMAELYTRLEREHSEHVATGATLARAADIPGTPILIAGKAMVVGYGAAHWEQALRTMQMCN